MHYGREESFSTVRQTSLSCPSSLLLSNGGQIVFCDGICQWGRPDVSDTTMWKVQRTNCSVLRSGDSNWYYLPPFLGCRLQRLEAGQHHAGSGRPHQDCRLRYVQGEHGECNYEDILWDP